MSAQRELINNLNMVQNNPANVPISADVNRALTKELDRILTMMKRQPNTYTPNNLEFRVFNAMATRPMQNDPSARAAIARHWNWRREDSRRGSGRGR